MSFLIAFSFPLFLIQGAKVGVVLLKNNTCSSTSFCWENKLFQPTTSSFSKDYPAKTPATPQNIVGLYCIILNKKIMNFLKSNLLYNHYSWTAMPGDNPKISGVPDSTLFNRNEGYEVLYLINKFLEKHSLSSIQAGQKVERMIRVGLPGDVRSQRNVMDWVAANWKKF
jgi:hypothetical protein